MQPSGQAQELSLIHIFGVLTWMVLRIVRGKIRDIHPVMWIVFALFVIRIVTLVI